MESTASWRLLPPASSPSPAFLGLQPRRQAAFVSSLQRPAISKSTILCLLHDKPAPTAQSSVQLQKLASVLQCAAVWAAVEAPAALATVSGEEDLDLLGILPPIAAIAFVYLFVAPKKAKAAPAAAPPPAVCEALLLATVCMVGLPVEVQVRDGSAYAGVFHTASVDGGYGVVLRKARKIANGKENANLSLGAFVDTLVVLPDDLVQVIAKDFSLPMKDIAKTTACGVMATSLEPQTSHLKAPKASRQVEKCSRQCQNSDISIGKVAPSINSSSSDVKTSQPVSNLSTKVVMSSKNTAKESKLNPHAKVFAPSLASTKPVHAVVPPVNPNYISNSVARVPTGIPVFQSQSLPGSSSLSSKVVHYNNLAPGNFGISPQYVQSIVGHNVGRLDPARLGTPYHPLQVGSTYISPSPQPVLDGKFSPFLYVHPACQDAMHGAPVISQGWPRPVLLNSYQSSLQKFQGTAPFYGAPPVMATGNLPMVVPSPAPLVQSFQAIHPIMLPSATSMFPGKYM